MLVHIWEIVMPIIRSWSFDRKEWSDANALTCKDPSRTVQSMKDEADINTIVRNFGVTGKVPVNLRVPEYGDFDAVSDYRQAIEAVRAAEASFLSVPSELRNRLDNDPQRFLEYCADKGNLEEMRKFGIAVVNAAPVPPSGSEGS